MHRSFIFGAMLGSSPLVFSVDRKFSPSFTEKKLVFNGLYSFTLSYLMMCLVTPVVILPFHERFPQYRKHVNSVIIVLLPLGFILAGIATSVYANVPLLYIGIVLFVGTSYAVYDLLARIEVGLNTLI